MTEEIVNENFVKTSNNIKSLDEAVEAVINMEKIMRSKKPNILWVAYQQDHLFEKFKAN